MLGGEIQRLLPPLLCHTTTSSRPPHIRYVQTSPVDSAACTCLLPVISRLTWLGSGNRGLLFFCCHFHPPLLPLLELCATVVCGCCWILRCLIIRRHGVGLAYVLVSRHQEVLPFVTLLAFFLPFVKHPTSPTECRVSRLVLPHYSFRLFSSDFVPVFLFLCFFFRHFTPKKTKQNKKTKKYKNAPAIH